MFQWNPEAAVDVEPISLRLDISDGPELLELDLRMRSEEALPQGAHCQLALISKLKEQGNLWRAYGKGEEIDGREHDSMDPVEESDWAGIHEQMGLPHVPHVKLVRALDDFSDCAIDFRYSDTFLQSMAQTLSMPLEYLEAWQVEGDEVIVDLGDDKIRGLC